MQFLKSIISVFTSTTNGATGEAQASSKKIWFNVSSAITFAVPLVGLFIKELKFSDFLSYMTVIYPVAMAGYAVGKYVDGKNVVENKKVEVPASVLGVGKQGGQQ